MGVFTKLFKKTKEKTYCCQFVLLKPIPPAKKDLN